MSAKQHLETTVEGQEEASGGGAKVPRGRLVCTIVHTKPIFSLPPKWLVCTIVHTQRWGARVPSAPFSQKEQGPD